MPRPFSDEEREIIYNRLLTAGRECWERYGIRRTSVDELSAMAGIAKGSFYSFFPSKELLFMAIIEHGHDEIKQKLMEVILREEGSPRSRFVSAVTRLYEEIKQNRWMVSLMSGQGELEYLLRKLPREKIEQHKLGDDEDTKQLFALLGVSEAVRPELVSAALRGLFFMLLHGNEIGEEELDNAFILLLKGLAIQIFEEEPA